MQKDAEHSLNPIEWAQDEAKKDLPYWKDRCKNGSGLIQQIANFVLKQAGE